MRSVPLVLVVALVFASAATAQDAFDYGIADPVANVPIGGTGVTAIADDGAHLAAASGTLVAWCDLDGDGQATVAGSLDLGVQVVDVAVSGPLLLAAAGTSGLYVVDFADPAQPVVRKQVPSLSWSAGIAAAGGYAYLADRTYLRILDLADPDAPAELQTLAYAGGIIRPATYVAVSAGRCWTMSQYGSFWAWDVADPAQPVLLRDDPDPMMLSGGFDVQGDVLFWLWGSPEDPPYSPAYANLEVEDVSDPNNPASILHRSIAGADYAAIAGDATTAVIATGGTAYVYDLGQPTAAPLQVPVADGGMTANLRGRRLDFPRGASLDVIALDRLNGPILSRTPDNHSDMLTDLEYDDGRAFCRFDIDGTLDPGGISSHWIDIFDVTDPTAVSYLSTTAYWDDFSKNAGATDNNLDVWGDYLSESGWTWNWRTNQEIPVYWYPSRTVSRLPAVYALGWPGPLDVYDATDPTALTYVSTPVPSGAWQAAVRGDRLVVGLTNEAAVFDVSEPLAPVSMGSVTLAATPAVVACDGPLAAAGVGTWVRIIRSDAGVVMGGAVDLGLTVRHLAVRGPVVYVSAVGGGGAKLMVIDASDPDAPVLKGQWTPLRMISGMALAPHALLAIEGTSMVAYMPDVLDPDEPSGPVSPVPANPVLHLDAPVPNPFNPSTDLGFALERAGTAELAIYDAAGRRVRTLVTGVLSAGAHTVTWDGRDDGGRGVAAGVYLARLKSGAQTAVRKLTLVK